MNWLTILFNLIGLTAVGFWALNGVATFIARFDRRPACTQCGRKESGAFTCHWWRDVADTAGGTRLRVQGSWTACSKHAGAPAPAGLADLMAWADKLEPERSRVGGGAGV